MKKHILMGIDGGGTYTRVIITNEKGQILSHIKHQGGASFHKNPNAIDDVQKAMLIAIQKANIKATDIDVVVAGIAGYDKEEDLKWVNQLTQIEGLNAKIINLNDAKIAHAGALLGKSGIICIAGTGSIVLGLNEGGRYLRNYDFHHNAYGASRLLSYTLMHHVLAGHTDKTDEHLIKQLCTHFHVNNLKELALLGSYGFETNTALRDQQFGEFTKHITQAALEGSHLAKEICHQTAKQIVTGIEVVASCFESTSIPVSLIGSVCNAPYMYQEISKLLENTKFQLQSPILCPELGAIILGMQALNISITQEIIDQLTQGNKID